MALLGRAEIIEALCRLGELASADGIEVRLIIVGGAAMVLGFDARLSTQDVDAVFLTPPEAQQVRAWVREVAVERGWSPDWLNDGAKGFMAGITAGRTVLKQKGIEVRLVSTEQLFAMKLSAWRDDVDIADAERLLKDLRTTGTRDEVWERVSVFLYPGTELKAKYAFEDIWND